MTITVGTILLICALVCFLLAAFATGPRLTRYRWEPIGLAFCVAASLVGWMPLRV